jgi:site-specific DNA-methyltransferase (adenine-specific)
MGKELQNRTLYFGDNLEILREKIPDESVDLIYLDPPFNSNRNYNILYKEGLVDSPAQVQAFEDSWHWTQEAERVFEELVGLKSSQTKINQNISDLMLALEKMIGKNDMLAYLTMMAIRLIELKRVLKSTGSIYLHCDSTASHYLKIVMDAIFGKENFRNEIIWQRTHAHGGGETGFSRVHDTILFYSKSDNFIMNRQHQPYSESYIKNFFIHNDRKGRYRLVVAHGPGASGSDYVWKGKTVPQGRHWAYKKERMEELDREGKLYYSKTGMPYVKQYLDEKSGTLVSDIWTDIEVIHSQSKERLGYPTQKPEALLERLIKASSNDGDWVLDPFCGCGTTVAVAEKLNRKWIGIDITTLAINLIKSRMQNKFANKNIQINVDGLPRDLSGAKELAHKNRFEFEYWALSLVNAMPSQDKSKENMRGADKGVDGNINFYKKLRGGQEVGKAIVQVKSGHVKRNDIAMLKGDIARENAEAGLFITLEEPTQPMEEEVAGAGSFTVDYSKNEFPKIQILAVEELLHGKKPDLPAGWYHPHHKEAEVEKINNQQDLF